MEKRLLKSMDWEDDKIERGENIIFIFFFFFFLCMQTVIPFGGFSFFFFKLL